MTTFYHRHFFRAQSSGESGVKTYPFTEANNIHNYHSNFFLLTLSAPVNTLVERGVTTDVWTLYNPVIMYNVKRQRNLYSVKYVNFFVFTDCNDL
jgi:hypothetical protein